MFILHANKTKLNVWQREQMTSGSVNVYNVKFEFSEDWDGLERVAVFQAGGDPVSILLDDSAECVIPPEVLTTPGIQLMVGVYGTRNGDTVLPTIWANLGVIMQGVLPIGGSYPPTPDLWEQELAKKGDGLKYDGLNLSLMSGDKSLSTVQITGGGESVAYDFGHGLKQEGLKVSVDMSSSDNPDKTLPISAAAVESTVGNIEILLQTI